MSLKVGETQWFIKFSYLNIRWLINKIYIKRCIFSLATHILTKIGFGNQRFTSFASRKAL